MFTGLVETVGTVRRVETRAGAVRLAVASALPAAATTKGASIAVDGVCLTVASRSAGAFVADVIPETLACTTLGALRPGARVNLERALRAGDPLGGHLVQGHVDGTAGVLAVERRGADRRLRLELPGPLRRYVALKGSIALQGVSLTVSGLKRREFEVALIPTTLAATTLGRVRAGERLNVEVDLVARYLERLTAKEPR